MAAEERQDLQLDAISKAVDGLGLFNEGGDDVSADASLAVVAAPAVMTEQEKRRLLVQDIDLRLKEGYGEFIQDFGYEKPLSEEEFAKAVEELRVAANEAGADISVVRKAKDKPAAGYLVRRRYVADDFIEIRICVVGNVDAGKSTLLGVLTHNELDNGRGRSRQLIFRHKHEQETGRTSSISHDIMGFDSVGNVVNKPAHDMSLDWASICTESSKVLTFIDLAGHEKYLKTTVFGFTGHAPHFAMLMIGSNMGIVGMTKEHLRISLALNVPVFVVVTKIDMCPEPVLADTMNLLTRILKSPGCRKVPMVVSNEDDAVMCGMNFVSQRICPIFQVSNVTGQNLDLLKKFLNLLNPRQEPNLDKPAEFQIDETYNVPGVGAVVSGTTLCGRIKINDTLLLGPDSKGDFQNVVVKGIHRRRMPTTEARGGQTASLALKKIKRAAIRKGMVMVAPEVNPRAVWEFEAEIRVLHHPTTIGTRYQAMLHCGSVRQTAYIKQMEAEHIRTGDKTKAIFRFIKSPEYLHVGSPLVFREGQTKAVGQLLRLVYPEDAAAAAADYRRAAGAVGVAGVGAGAGAAVVGAGAPGAGAGAGAGAAGAGAAAGTGAGAGAVGAAVGGQGTVRHGPGVVGGTVKKEFSVGGRRHPGKAAKAAAKAAARNAEGSRKDEGKPDKKDGSDGAGSGKVQGTEEHTS